MHGGEHSLLGYSTFDAGIVLDLSLVRSVRAASPKRTAQPQAGLCWGELDAVTEQHRLALTGGQVSHTGIAALTLRAGIGWPARQFDLMTDHLQAVA